MAKSKSGVSPIRSQYLSLKQEHQDTILFFRLGDFYETFDEDAHTVADALDIVLTSRSVGKGQRVPMAGIPHHAMENYLSRLIDRGHHVAICEQIGTETVNGILPREVVRIVTPGTVVEPGLLPGDQNNYLVSLVFFENKCGIAYVDITTGEFSATQIQSGNIQDVVRAEITRLAPAEIILPETNPVQNGLNGSLTKLQDWKFEAGRCEQNLKSHFEVESLDGFGMKGKSLAVRAAGAIIQYLKDTQPEALNLLTRFGAYSLSEYMTLDATTRRNLELTETIRSGTEKGSLLEIVDQTITPMGKRMLRSWLNKPLLDLEQIQARQEGITFFFKDNLLREDFREALKKINDLERIINRVLGASALPRDLVALRSNLAMLPELQQMLAETEGVVSNRMAVFDVCGKEYQLLQNAIEEEPPATLAKSGVIRAGFSAELDKVVDSSQHARDWIAALEPTERERTGIKNLKVGYNKVFGYYLEVTKSNVALVPDDYIRKQTLVNSERYITPDMKEYENLVLNAEERIREVEARLFGEVCQRLAASSRKILETARIIAELDCFASLAEVARAENYICPEVVEEDVLEIEESRHPVVENLLERGQRFIPNDIQFEPAERIRIITGPNMSGKSTYLRQVALIVLLAQMGSYVPAKSARIGLVDRIFTRIGAQDEIHAGQSTFMVEMVEMANILNHATPRSLLILDEVGRGTSTFDGVSIAWSVVEYIHNHPGLRAKTLFATHYHELTRLEELLPGVRNYHVAVSESEGRVLFLHKIVPGGSDRSYGIHVGQLAGLPAPVISRANDLLAQLEATSGDFVEFDKDLPEQMALFPTTNPLLDKLAELDVNNINPVEALNILFNWQQQFLEKKRSKGER